MTDGWIIFHCIGHHILLHPFFWWQTFYLFPYLAIKWELFFSSLLPVSPLASLLLLSLSSYCLPHDRWNTLREVNCWGKGIATLFRKPADPRRCWTTVPKNHLSKVSIQASFILRREEVWLVVTNFLEGILCSCNCRSGHNIPVNLQQDNCYFLFLQLLSYINGKVLCFERSEPWEWAIIYISGYGNFILQSCRASMTQHRQQSTRVRAKEADLIWSHVYSSLL